MLADDPIADDPEARARVGRAIRRLGHAFVGRQAPPDLLEEVAATLDELTARLAAGGPRQRAAESFERESWTNELPQGVIGAYDDRPFSGRSSPWGLDLEMHRHGDVIEGLLTLGPAHEGAPARSTAASSPVCSTTSSGSCSGSSRSRRSPAS